LQEIVEDQAPEPPDEAVTKPGDLIVMGKPPAAVRRQREPAARRPAARRGRDSSLQHRPAVQREG
jgi:hypothetical protein